LNLTLMVPDAADREGVGPIRIPDTDGYARSQELKMSLSTTHREAIRRFSSGDQKSSCGGELQGLPSYCPGLTGKKSIRPN